MLKNTSSSWTRGRKMKIKNNAGLLKSIGLLLLVGICLSGCGLTNLAIKKGYDFTKIKRIAIVDFSSTSGFRNSGDAVADEFVLQLMKRDISVIERNKLNAILTEQNLGQSGRLDPDTVKKIGKILGVDAILTGSVIKYKEEQDQQVYTTDLSGRSVYLTVLKQA